MSFSEGEHTGINPEAFQAPNTGVIPDTLPEIPRGEDIAPIPKEVVPRKAKEFSYAQLFQKVSDLEESGQVIKSGLSGVYGGGYDGPVRSREAAQILATGMDIALSTAEFDAQEGLDHLERQAFPDRELTRERVARVEKAFIAVHAENAQLREENERLATRNADDDQEIIRLQAEVIRLQALQAPRPIEDLDAIPLTHPLPRSGVFNLLEKPGSHTGD